MKKKYTILGNCQVGAISVNLEKNEYFKDNYEYIYIPPVYTIRNCSDTGLYDKLKSVDLLITQPIKDKSKFGQLVTKSLRRSLKNCKIITFPSIYFNGYFPTLGMMPGVKTALNNVHDFSIVAGFLAKLQVDDMVQMLVTQEKYFISHTEIEKLALRAVNALKQREVSDEIDIQVSPIINEYFRKERLFHQFNHPTTRLIGHVCSEILERLDMAVLESNKKIVDKLNMVVAPIYPAIAEALDLEFDISPATFSGFTVEIKKFVETSYEAYSNIDKTKLLLDISNTKPFLIKIFSL